LLTGTPDGLIAQAQQALTLLVSGVTGVINIAFTGFGMLFVSVYLVSDSRKLEAAYLKVAPHRYRPDAAVLWGSVDLRRADPRRLTRSHRFLAPVGHACDRTGPAARGPGRGAARRLRRRR
jgi:hypothetical protein